MTPLLENRTVYWLIRPPLAAFGLLLVSLTLSSRLFPEIARSENPDDSTERLIALLIYGLLLLLPHRWFMNLHLYILKLVSLAIGTAEALSILVTGIIGLAQGKKHWLIVPFSLILVMLTALAPLSVIMKKRIVDSRQSAVSSEPDKI